MFHDFSKKIDSFQNEYLKRSSVTTLIKHKNKNKNL